VTTTTVGREQTERPGARGAGLFDVDRIRSDFPILAERVHGSRLTYLDNAATSQKPRQVIAAVTGFYEHQNANIHRGVHHLSQRATEAYEGVREKVRRFLNASEVREIIFVRGTTEAINLVAQSYGRANVGPGDEVVVSAMEHHSNIVPWQMLCGERGATLKIIPMLQSGDLQLDEYERLLTNRTRIVAVAHVSNALGTVNPVRQMAAMARERGIPVLVDGAQAAPHLPIDVREIGCDFYTISGHKMFGPTGIGSLYGRAELLEAMPPYQGGGDMIRSVTFEETTFAPIPSKFEAGTPAIAEVVGLGAAIEYLESIGREQIVAYESDLVRYAVKQLGDVAGVRLVGAPQHRAAVVSFVFGDVHAHDLGTVLDQHGVAVRTGHHCAQPVMDFYGLPATARASFALYNTREDVDALIRGLEKAKEVFGVV
jgi:cysteine desulfurase / selenocysteine lyase